MQFIQRLLGLTAEEQKGKPSEVETEAIPKANLDVERELFRVSSNCNKLQDLRKRLEQEQMELTRAIKKLTLENRLIEARKIVKDLNESRKRLEEAKQQLKQQRLRKTNLQVDRMKLIIQHEASKAERFMTGMMEVNKKMKSLQPKETEGCLEYTNQLIKMLAGEKEAEELKNFYLNIAEEEEEKKEQSNVLIHQTSYIDPNLSDDGTLNRRSSVKYLVGREPLPILGRQQPILRSAEYELPDAVLSSLMGPSRQKGPSSAEIDVKDHRQMVDLSTPKTTPILRKQQSYQPDRKHKQTDALL